jgi:hypothetical protein
MRAPSKSAQFGELFLPAGRLCSTAQQLLNTMANTVLNQFGITNFET